MEITKKEFEIEFFKRLSELKKYIDFLSMIENGIYYVDKNNKKKSYVNHSEIRVILRANAHLLIYNLVEYTLSNLCMRIISELNKDELSYEKLIETIQRFWIELNKNKYSSPGIQTDKLVDNLTDLIRQTLDDNAFKFNAKKIKDNLQGSGNVKEKTFAETAKRYGFQYDHKQKVIQDGYILNLICENRQKLSHGDSTFSDVGKDLSTESLREDFKKVKKYLLLIIKNVEEYLKTKQYMKKDVKTHLFMSE